MNTGKKAILKNLPLVWLTSGIVKSRGVLSVKSYKSYPFFFISNFVEISKLEFKLDKQFTIKIVFYVTYLRRSVSFINKTCYLTSMETDAKF